MRRFAFAPASSIAGACLALLAAPPAHAGTAWLCNLSEDAVRLICVADVDPADLAVSTPTASVKGTKFPLDPRQLYTVDLWSPPSEPDRLELLARATICFRSPDCTVTVAPVAWSVASMQRLRTASKR